MSAVILVVIFVLVIALLCVVDMLFKRSIKHIRAKLLSHYKLYATNFEIKTQTEACEKSPSELKYTIRVFYNEKWSWLLTRKQRQVMNRVEYDRVDAEKTRDLVVKMVEVMRNKSLKNIEESHYKNVVKVGDEPQKQIKAHHAVDCLDNDVLVDDDIDPQVTALAKNQTDRNQK